MHKLSTGTTRACILILAAALTGSAAAIENISLANSLSASDDQTSGDVHLGFSILFGSASFSTVAVNTNGNLSLGDGGFGQGTPSPLSSLSTALIAPFWADVDTRGGGAIRYGSATVAGRQSFVATYTNVGYYLAKSDKTNSFQVIIFDRSETGAGNFDIEFNYDRIQWESGDDSGGVGGVGGATAVAGFNSDLGATQLPGSLTPGAFVDAGTASLIANSLQPRGGVAGRYDFSIRNGQVVSPVPEPSSLAMASFAFLAAAVWRARQHRSH